MSSHNDGSDVLVRCDEIKELKNSYLLDDDVFVGKGAVTHVDLDTNEIWVPMWLAEKEGLDYE